ncbi:hypothetical protein [Paenibacillus nasutitermitis]|uniref:SurA N-terminal domain-containing protein n=1 Tax=Paenibacillus nasutitermitis TaxID=1652958 RepID=A0A916YJ34_9BACL|nr:hypothetical protein [Paenibacillus nasutitermitis]GGD47560.1 hypothetical protein GCM10010911_01330 [Paenibacillus nasutitermitis]
MTKKNKLTAIVALVALILITTIAFAVSNRSKTSSTDESIETASSSSSKEKTNADTVAEVGGMAINHEHFIIFKANFLLLNAVQKNDPIPSDRELLNQLIMEGLVVEQATQQGITATGEEINEVIQYERKTFETFKPTNKDQEAALEFMKNRIKISGHPEDEFWESDIIKEATRRSVLSGKYMSESIANGTFKDVDGFMAYQQKQFDGVKDQIIYK